MMGKAFSLTALVLFVLSFLALAGSAWLRWAELRDSAGSCLRLLGFVVLTSCYGLLAAVTIGSAFNMALYGVILGGTFWLAGACIGGIENYRQRGFN